MKGDDKPRDAAETIEFAMAFAAKGLNAPAARFYADALAADPKLGDDLRAQHRYNAACASLLTAAGQGGDGPKPDDAAKAKLREQARIWLKAELAAWSATDDPMARAAVPQVLCYWKADPDLASVRDPAALASLPEDERGPWRALWAEVGRLLEGTAH